MNSNLYPKIYEWKNIVLAFKKARKGKTKKKYVVEFERNLGRNLRTLQFELMTLTYSPKSLKTFVLRDPKTRKISKSDFRDRIIHHAICNIIEPIFRKSFIYDSCANQKSKGTLFAIKRFDKFKRKVTFNLKREAFCLKCDIRHYFFEINHQILIKLIKRKILDIPLISLIKLILKNYSDNKKGMPLGNLTSQFFANVYLNKLDHFVKHTLKIKFYIRYVDDFVILHSSKTQLQIWKKEINNFLNKKLKLELHKDKSKIISLSKGIDFVGFRNFYYNKRLRKRSVTKIMNWFFLWRQGKINFEELFESFQGWQANARWANCFRMRLFLFWIIYFISEPFSISSK